ncbi:MAG: hypothetical protein SGILL_009326 [Bacillariaceae sp.]
MESPKPDYDFFEKMLTNVLVKDLGYDAKNIIRNWNMDKSHSAPNGKDSAFLTGPLSQYKDHALAINNATSPYVLQPTVLNLATRVMDSMTGWDLYQLALGMLDEHWQQNGELFRGLLISTEGMDAKMFRQRNIVGRLLVVAMAVQSSRGSHSRYTEQKTFEEAYMTACKAAFPEGRTSNKIFPSQYCKLLGSTGGDIKNATKLENFGVLLDESFKRKYSKLWDDWRNDLCHRFTQVEEKHEMQGVSNAVKHSIQNMAFGSYWKGLGESGETPNLHEEDEQPVTFEKPPLLHGNFSNMKVPNRGIILDVVETPSTQEEIEAFMQHMSALGFNTLQLSMLNAFGTSLFLQGLTLLYHVVPTPPQSSDPLSEVILRNLVRTAAKLGIHIIPEISSTTDAVGWYHAGFLLDCPKAFCETGMITNDISRGSMLPILLEIIRRLHDIFIESSPFIHLGSDERNSSKLCWEESGKAGDYDLFESRLAMMLTEKNMYNESSVLRWENKEGILYKNRLGLVTQYRYRLPSQVDRESAFFGSISIAPDTDPWETYSQTLEWAALKPEGLLLKISAKDLAVKKLNLVAFAAGLSSSPRMNQEELSQFLSATCKQNPDWCPQDAPKQRGKPPSRTDALCKSMTKSTPTPIRKMRKEPLSSSDTAADPVKIE